jgi:RNA polymerase sigma-70 factor (ECF subfamily)
MPEPDITRERRFDELFGRHMPAIQSYCRWRSRNSADSEDSVSEVFLTLWRRLDELGDDAQVRVWLYATARRVTANHLRAHRRSLGLVDRLLAQPAPLPELQPHDVDGTTAERVREALAGLRDLDREVLLLSAWEELSPAEIAEVLGCRQSSARGRLHRARRRFRESYERLFPGMDPNSDTELAELHREQPHSERSLCDA